jgi:hypothetical protein
VAAQVVVSGGLGEIRNLDMRNRQQPVVVRGKASEDLPPEIGRIFDALSRGMCRPPPAQHSKAAFLSGVMFAPPRVQLALEFNYGEILLETERESETTIHQ